MTGTLTNPGDEATYTFTGSPGQNVFFDGLSGASGIDAESRQPQRRRDLLRRGERRRRALHALGARHLHPDDLRERQSTGSYEFRLLDTSAQTLTPTSTATTVSGTITPGTGTNIYRIAGTAGEQINLTSDSFSSTSGNWYLYDPNNNEVAGAAFGSSFSATLRLNGPYELVLEGSDTTDSSVTYKFDITATTPGVGHAERVRHRGERHAGRGRVDQLHVHRPGRICGLLQQPEPILPADHRDLHRPQQQHHLLVQPLLQRGTIRPDRIRHLHADADQHQRQRRRARTTSTCSTCRRRRRR